MDREDLGLRERKRRRTHRALEEAALRLFAEHGFEATTVARIAAAAEVSPRTFFHHFASKEDVVLGDYEARLARLTERLATRPADEPPLAAIRAALLAVATDYEAERERLLQRARIVADTPSVLARSLEVHARWEEAVAHTIARRLGVGMDDDLRPGLTAAVTVAAMRVAQQRWLASDGTTPLPTLLGEALDLLEAGLGRLGTAHDHGNDHT